MAPTPIEASTDKLSQYLEDTRKGLNKSCWALQTCLLELKGISDGAAAGHQDPAAIQAAAARSNQSLAEACDTLNQTRLSLKWSVSAWQRLYGVGQLGPPSGPILETGKTVDLVIQKVNTALDEFQQVLQVQANGDQPPEAKIAAAADKLSGAILDAGPGVDKAKQSLSRALDIFKRESNNADNDDSLSSSIFPIN